MDIGYIAALLRPYIGSWRPTEDQLRIISSYVDLMTRWNARMNLTAVRDPEEMVRRHFGESLFAARNLLAPDMALTVADVGSGAGFPGIPIKIYAPSVTMTLIEAHGKKATFLREAIRVNKFTNVNIFQDRAERWSDRAELVVLRAVEKFEEVLPVAGRLVSDGGRLGLLIGAAQGELAEQLLPGAWQDPVAIPESANRVLQIWSKP